MDRLFRRRLKSDQGYLLITTLFFLVLTGLLTQMLIKISSNHIIQLRQFSEAYQAKTVLNMSESILHEYIETNEEIPVTGKINTSLGIVNLQKTTDNEFALTVTLANGMEYHQFTELRGPTIEESKPEPEPEKELED